jgi:pimeloyl-ACP methyl ester carboxylesterase
MRTLLCLAVATMLAACGGLRPGRAPERCTRVQVERQVRGDSLCEDVFSCTRPPGGRFDRVGLHRLAPCGASGGTAGPVVLYLPGMHMNGEIPETDARYDFRLHLALAGVRTWSLDWRTHGVPAGATLEELGELARWTADVFTDDAAWAAAFVRGADPGPLYVAGFGFGAGVAYRLAARKAEPIAGLVVLDGVPPGATAAPEGAGPAIDVGGGRLPWDERDRLLRTVIASPENPSPVPGYTTAGEALADVVYTSPTFGGHGGLSAARDGVADVGAVARLLASYDRWWPRAALGGSAVTPSRTLPLLAFASRNMGPQWIERVRAGARAFGGDRAIVHELPRYGHVDVLVGAWAERLVFEPILGFVTAAGRP